MTLEIRGLSFSYKEKTVLSGIDLSVREGEMVSLLGKNGAGKTTLLRLIPGFLKPDEGTITFDGTPVGAIKLRQRAGLMAYIPQITRSAFPYSVRTSILMGCSSRLSLMQSPGKREEAKVEQMIELLNLQEIAGRTMDTISGGERQLVLVARALMQDARLLILDEPTSFLDYSNQLLVLEKVGELVRKGYSCIYSTHNPDLALTHSSRVVAMADGGIVYDDRPENLIGNDVLSRLYGRHISIVRTENGRLACIPE